jgi:hypothetical protein
MPRIDSLTEESWRQRVSASNARMATPHNYPRCEGLFLGDCCAFQEPGCTESCFCREVKCDGVWTLRPDVKFEVFLSHYCNLWVRGAHAFIEYVENDSPTGWPSRWKYAVPLLREIGRRWSKWDEHGSSLPSVVSKIRRCYFCDDSFSLIMPIVEDIEKVARDTRSDTSGVFTSKLVSQLFYDIAVPFDDASWKCQKACGYEPERYGNDEMREQAKTWLRDNKKTIGDFRKLDNAPQFYWFSPGRGTACSRVLDKLFYGHKKQYDNGSAKKAATQKRAKSQALKARAAQLGILDEVNEKAEEIAQANYEKWKTKKSRR